MQSPASERISIAAHTYFTGNLSRAHTPPRIPQRAYRQGSFLNSRENELIMKSMSAQFSVDIIGKEQLVPRDLDHMLSLTLRFARGFTLLRTGKYFYKCT